MQNCFISSGLSLNDIFIAYCPERVLPGNILTELIFNDRVIGGVNEQSSLMAFNFYQNFCKGKINRTNVQTAELVKLTENAYRDVNLAFANEMSIICDDLNIDAKELINLANMHPRVNILNPGCGVGGHCISVDPLFIVSSFPEKTQLIQSARRVNENKKNWCIELIKSKVNIFKLNKGYDPVIGCCGLAYKPNIDDLRESPAEQITLDLINKAFISLLANLI